MTVTKKLATVVLLVAMLFTLTGCGRKSEPISEPEQQSESQDRNTIRVATVLSGPVNDNGWNATGYAGLKKIEEELGAEVAFSDQVPVPEFEETFRDYASKGYDLIIGHGDQFSEAAATVASEFPDVKFAVINGNKTASNLSTFSISDAEVSFLAGAVAGLCTESNVVSAIGGMEIPPTLRSLEGYKAGANHVNPEAQVLLAYTGSFTDAAKAKEAAMAQLSMGSDVIFYYLDAASPGVIQACEDEGAKAIATITDQYDQAPDTILTSTLTDLSSLILDIGRLASEGQLEGKAYVYGVANEDIVSLAPFRGSVSEEVEAKIEEIRQGIIEGEIELPAM